MDPSHFTLPPPGFAPLPSCSPVEVPRAAKPKPSKNSEIVQRWLQEMPLDGKKQILPVLMREHHLVLFRSLSHSERSQLISNLFYEVMQEESTVKTNNSGSLAKHEPE